jgi:alcohol dehydrogenase class IV
VTAPGNWSAYRAASQQVLFGEGALGGLGETLGRLDVKRPLLVTSPSVAGRTSVVDRVLAALPAAVRPVVFTGSREHTPIATVAEAFAVAQQAGADGVLGVGGGSAMDTAKGVAIALTTGSPDLDAYVGSLERQGADVRAAQPVNRRVPVVQIPTTLSAAEATGQAGITLASGVKEQFYHPAIAAAAIVLDPVLTVETPEQLWLSTGVKALDHAVEVACSRLGNDVSQALALQTIRVVVTCLPQSRKDPADLAVRSRLQISAWMVLHGAVSTNAGVGLDHAIVHRLGGRFGVPHGGATCVTLPYAMEANLPGAVEALSGIARWGLGLGVGEPDDVAAGAAVDGVRRLISELGLPDRLRQWIPDRASLDEVAPSVLTDTAMAGNPRRDLTVHDVVELLHRAW